MIGSFLLLTIGLLLLAISLTRQLHCIPTVQYHYIARSPYDIVPDKEKATKEFDSMFNGTNVR